MNGRKKSILLTTVILAIMITAIGGISVDGEETRSSQSDQDYGYTLYGDSTNAYLLDMDGEPINTWSFSTFGGYSYYLTEDGCVIRPGEDRTSMMRGGAIGGYVHKMDWEGNLIWDFEYSGTDYQPHHDIEPLPNGNVLLIVWEVKSVAEATTAGVSTIHEIWPDYIVEIEPDGLTGGNVVWEWHVWDHLVQDTNPLADNYGVVEDQPELIDGNMRISSPDPNSDQSDWMHMNSVSYNEELDLIAFTSHFFNEVYVIDHSTTTQEAAGHSGGDYGMGGDILYRWGNPSNYGASGETYFDTVHYCNWVEDGYPGEGNILAFNNNEGEGASEVVEISPTTDGSGNFVIPTDGTSMYSDQEWTYSEGSSMYTAHQGSNQRLSNGNTLIATGTSGSILEVTPAGETVWSFTDAREVKMSLRYSPDYPGLVGLMPSCEITYPEDDETLSGVVNIRGILSSSDDTSSVDLVQVSFDGSSIWLDADGVDPWTYEWDTTEFSDGTHTISARAASGGAVSAVFEIDVTTDNGVENEEPLCSITYPGEGDTVNSVISITGTASDPDGSVELVQVSIGDDDTWDEADGTTSWSFQWDTSEVDNGYWDITARSYDGSSFSDTSSISVLVENEVENDGPTCEITSLDEDQEVSGTITLSGSSEDTDGSVEEVEISVDGENWEEADGTSSWIYTLDTTSLSNGYNTIYARSIDDSGSMSSIAQININVDNGSNGQSGVGLIIIVIIVIMAILVILGILLFNRRKGTETIQSSDRPVYADHLIEATVLEEADEDGYIDH